MLDLDENIDLVQDLLWTDLKSAWYLIGYRQGAGQVPSTQPTRLEEWVLDAYDLGYKDGQGDKEL